MWIVSTSWVGENQYETNSRGWYKANLTKSRKFLENKSFNKEKNNIHKTKIWPEPMFIKDKQINNHYGKYLPNIVPIFKLRTQILFSMVNMPS